MSRYKIYIDYIRKLMPAVSGTLCTTAYVKTNMLNLNEKIYHYKIKLDRIKNC